jgi:hypothetical protein
MPDTTPPTLLSAVLTIVEHAARNGMLRMGASDGAWAPPYTDLQRWLKADPIRQEPESNYDRESLAQLRVLASGKVQK